MPRRPARCRRGQAAPPSKRSSKINPSPQGADGTSLPNAPLDAPPKAARPVFSPPKVRSTFGERLEAEETLDLGPDREAEDDEHEDEKRQRDGEAQAGELTRAAALDAQPSLRSMKAIRPANRLGRVDGRRLGRRRFHHPKFWFGLRH